MIKVIIAFCFIALTTGAFAKGGGHHSSYKGAYKAPKSYSYSTGSSSSHERVNGYVKNNGTYVSPYKRTTKDSTQYNNFSTKGNYNPYTHKNGTKKATH
ncbi:hypothetical protein J5069_08725 [Candidatus Symbiopectobacterium sp. NZEC127]|uniref:hypothetical protein n=1 Tax=Candidatus Symbiopectobacterium sp. NZEC127 TaxID=2820472 RepID=UPI0022270067|nr:hypothetical protein [Candidatus Symbiopectobacterium sp. NZEC127]MCW2485977.1 hypothetical protein [Candidatus Symbiopectobacterium sp. NZEC127]